MNLSVRYKTFMIATNYKVHGKTNGGTSIARVQELGLFN